MTVSQDKAIHCWRVSKNYPVQKDVQVLDIFIHGRARGEAIEVLKDISLDVPRGKIVGVLGRNGAGKSTLLRVLGGIYSPSSGMVEVNGEVVGLFELGGMGGPGLTGREYAERYLSITSAGVSVDELVSDVLDFSELGEAFDRPIRTYSSGMRARVYFATATALQHEIYLIDELLSVGDEHFQIKCWQRMRNRLLNGASGVLVTHDWTAILRLCEQAKVLEHGRFVFEGASDSAVVSYLKLPKADAAFARFTEENSRVHQAHSGLDTELHFFVEIFDDVAVDFSLSVETLRIGSGWEIMLLAADLKISENRGCHKISVNIPQIPLSPGNYSLNIFLSRRKHTPLDHADVLDSRTWTLGNGFVLEVAGRPCSAAVRLPYTVRRAGDDV